MNPYDFSASGLLLRSDEEYNRGDEEYKIAITAMGLSFGSLAISSKEKARTILRHGAPVDPEKEYEHIVERLGIEYTSVPDLGETPITNAALAVVKLAIFNSVNLDDVTEVDLATESAKELSKNRAVEIIKYVNMMSDALDRHGIHIGHLKERSNGAADRKAVHTNQHQSACDSAGQELYEDAKDGINLHSKKLLIASDHASYRKQRPEDETGGFGAVAMLIEPAATAKGGLLISSKFLGEANMDSMEFLKNVVYDIGGGISLINTDPIVMGNHSNYTYHFLAFNALLSAFKMANEHIRSIEDVAKYDLAWHVPYTNMPLDSIAYFYRHLSRINPELSAANEKELGVAEPLLPNFKRLETEFEFLHDIGEAYLPFSRIGEELSRISGSDLSETARNELASIYTAALERSLPQQAKLSALAMNRVIEKYNGEIGEDIVALIRSTAEGLLSASEKPSLSLKEVNLILEKLSSKITEFEKDDTKYNMALRRTEGHKALMEMTHTPESVEFSKYIGNIDTASAPLSLASLIANTENDKKICVNFYGSTSSDIWLMIEKRNIEDMKAAITANWKYEMERRRYINAEEYLDIERKRRIAPVANEGLPLFSTATFTDMNEEELLSQVRKMMDYSCSTVSNFSIAPEKSEVVSRVRSRSRNAE